MRWRRRDRQDEPQPPDVAHVARALAGGPLAGRAVSAIRVPGTDEHVITVPIDPDEILDAWKAARALVGTTGRWPLAITDFVSDGIDDTIFTGDGVAAAAIERAKGMTPEDGLAAIGMSRSELDDLDEKYGLADDEDGSHLDWFVPRRQATAIAFVPTAASEEAVAYVDLFPYDTRDELAALVAILRGWRERHGAELVASWGTMLQFVVERPPAEADAARRLADEQIGVAPDTIMLPGVLPASHARALVGRRTWFLHSRP